MTKKYEATFLGYFEIDTIYTTAHVFAFDVNIKSNHHEIKFFIAHEVEGYSDLLNKEYYGFCYYLSVAINSKDEDEFQKSIGTECLVTIDEKSQRVVKVFQNKGGQNGK